MASPTTSDGEAVSSSPPITHPNPPPRPAARTPHEDPYFRAYGDLSVHETMLLDRPRNDAYLRGIRENRAFLKDKVVLDVGTGTGFLAMLCVLEGGARHVHAVEGSEQIARVARDLIRKNGLESRITLHAGRRVEDLTVADFGEEVSAPLPPELSAGLGTPSTGVVDAIISEWMGFYLLHESMLDSVLVARDRFLVPNGLMLPATATIYASVLDLSRFYDGQMRYFEDGEFYGLKGFGDYFCALDKPKNEEVLERDEGLATERDGGGATEAATPAAAASRKRRRREEFVFSGEPNVTLGIRPSEVLAKAQTVVDFDLSTVTVAEIAAFSKRLRFDIQRPGRMGAVGLWFDCGFFERHTMKAISTLSHRVVLATGPDAPRTHWSQTVILFGQDPDVEPGAEVGVELALAQTPQNKRHYTISLEMF